MTAYLLRLSHVFDSEPRGRLLQEFSTISKDNYMLSHNLTLLVSDRLICTDYSQSAMVIKSTTSAQRLKEPLH